jgi:hypothetical protein
MKRLILILLVISFFPILVFGACHSERPMLDSIDRDNCVWGGGTWNSTDCTCSSGGSTSGSDAPTGGVVSGGIIPNPLGHDSFTALFEAIIDWTIDIALVLAPLLIIYGGFLHITSAGDPTKSSQGKKVIIYAAIGLIVVLLAKSLIGILEELVVI